MRRLTIGILLASLALSGAALAEGFGNKDLQTVAFDPLGFTGDGTFEAGSNDPGRLTVFCTGCSETTAIDILLQRSEDGTEQRYRSGETTIAKMEEICKSRSPSCELKAAELGGAVGWVTRYEAAGRSGSTTVLFLDGDQLLIRSIAGDLETAAANGAHALRTIGSQIIGVE